MSSTHKLLCIAFWLAVLLGVLGYIITFIPGAECSWFIIVAALSLSGLFIPKIFFRLAATILLIVSIVAAMDGHQRGMKYRQWLATHNNVIASPDPISRFVADYPNHEGVSIVYDSTGVASSMDPHEAIAKLRQTGIRGLGITNFALVELRELHPQDRDIARMLTNSVAALIDTEIGQRIVLLAPMDDVWCYHVYDRR